MSVHSRVRGVSWPVAVHATDIGSRITTTAGDSASVMTRAIRKLTPAPLTS